MTKGRLEAFSDGVLAIIITIMVLELKVPHTADLSGLRPLIPVFLSYVLSFIYIGIYWNNHHHLLHTAGKINGKILWANLHLLFWLSLVPFVTSWIGENHFASIPMLFYGVVLLMAGFAYSILQNLIIAHNGRDSLLSKAVGYDLKGKLSIGLYLSAIIIALYVEWFSGLIYIGVAIMWLIPDTRIERLVDKD
ncbi:TMEM175 family protein [Solitalea lacus]|uniref:TMEM175 family protein n=1 Tax=Solitalea lacus TaxID=2911172 RepID=UPI001EDC7AC0|nr:TMEM175 family protein [Solitalea lacus]UKJ08960.1 TMEM175 family protein [Solitalea lacus]